MVGFQGGAFRQCCKGKIGSLHAIEVVSVMRLYRSLVYLGAVVLCSVIAVACDGAFIAETKFGVPTDHTVNEDGAWHKPGYEHPFEARSGCSTSNCHHGDLKGGVAIVDGQTTSAPSCYQCHGREWDEDDVAVEEILIKPLRATEATR